MELISIVGLQIYGWRTMLEPKRPCDPLGDGRERPDQ
jgi:hypothetical protein